MQYKSFFKSSGEWIWVISGQVEISRCHPEASNPSDIRPLHCEKNGGWKTRVGGISLEQLM